MRQLVERSILLAFILYFYDSNDKNHCYFFIHLSNLVSLLYTVFELIDYNEYIADLTMMNRITCVFFVHYMYREIEKEIYSGRMSDITVKLMRLGFNITPFLYSILYIQFISYCTSAYCVSLMHSLPEYSFQFLQLEFNKYHKHFGNEIVHLITEIGSLISIFGMLDKSSILHINSLSSMQLTFFAYYSTKYSVGIIDENWTICLYSASTVHSATSFFQCLNMITQLNGFHYFMMMLLFVLLQELSHIVYQEEALMYNYKGDNSFIANFLFHGFFFIPLVSQLFIPHHQA